MDLRTQQEERVGQIEKVALTLRKGEVEMRTELDFSGKGISCQERTQSERNRSKRWNLAKPPSKIILSQN